MKVTVLSALAIGFEAYTEIIFELREKNRNLAILILMDFRFMSIYLVHVTC